MNTRDKPYNGFIDNWFVWDSTRELSTVMGEIYNHPDRDEEIGRLVDGNRIQTTPLIYIFFFSRSVAVIETENSIYTLGKQLDLGGTNGTKH